MPEAAGGMKQCSLADQVAADKMYPSSAAALSTGVTISPARQRRGPYAVRAAVSQVPVAARAETLARGASMLGSRSRAARSSPMSVCV